MHVLVTGGGGYIGSRLVPYLITQGHRVRVLDRFCFGEDARASFPEECEVVSGDVRRLQELPGLLDDIEAIVHLAGLSNDPTCALNAELAADVNVASTRELAVKAVERGIARFVLASSCQVYGHGVFDLLDEESPANPVSEYGRTKRAAELAVLELQGDHFAPVVARGATAFGPAPRMRFDLAVNQMTGAALLQKRIEVFGGGRQWRPFIHVDDLARALELLVRADAAKVSGRIFNTGANELNFQISALAERIAAYFGGIEIHTAKDEDDLRTFRVQFDRIRDELGFRCEHSLEDGVRQVCAFIEQRNIDPGAERYFNARLMRRLLATPVDEGGEPISPHFIPLYQPSLDEAEEEAVLKALRSGWLTSGPMLRQFEQMFGERVGAPHVVAASSCTGALQLCLAHLGIGPGDEVITSPITWASTGNTILHMGAKTVFADINPRTLNIDPAAIEAAITGRTRAIMPVHLAGQPCELDAIYAIARKRGIPVVEDAAHAVGATYKGIPIGAYGEYTCFSFYAIKNITTMEGGAVALKDADAEKHIRLLATNGMSATAWDRYGRSASCAPPQVLAPGFKLLMGNVNAAMGVEQLRKLDQFLAARRRLARMYYTVLSELDEIELPEIIEGAGHAWHLLIIRLRLDKLRKTRDEIAYDLRRENIGTSVHFYGLHLHPYYRDVLGFKPGDFPHATAASESILSLPLFPRMTDTDLRCVVDALKKVLRHARR